jgi:hypothetical protein
MSDERNFVDLCLAGNALLEEIDDFVDAWHAAPQEKELHEYLGMTDDEYSLWLRSPDALPYIIKARYDRKPLTLAVMQEYENMRLAARASDRLKIPRLLEWLRGRGILN